MSDGFAAASRLLAAVIARDFEGIGAAVANEARVRTLTPGGTAEMRGQDEVVARYRGWFADADQVEVRDTDVDRIADRTSLRYRLRIHDADGWQLIEQHAYLDVDETGRIATMDLVCSGFRVLEEGSGATDGTHVFDAGAMGCSDGLAQEFRRRILAIPQGELLVVETTDPAAKEDLPPLARMMGHTVRSVESPGDGRLRFTVERGR